MPPATKRLERKLKRLEGEIIAIESEYLSSESAPLEERVWLAETKRSVLTRAVLIEIHLSIEDIMTTYLRQQLVAWTASPAQRKKARQTGFAGFYSTYTPYVDELLEGPGAISFKQKMTLMRAVGALAPATYSELEKLNQIRNRCGHNWQINVRRRKNVKPAKRKRPLLEYDGKNLFELANLRDFISHYTGIYLRLFMKFA